jgi:excisionase family DNA binding protein
VILETPKQLAARLGLKERQIRSLIDSRKLEYVKIGSRAHIPDGAFERFVEANKVTPCQDGTRDQGSNGTAMVPHATSAGPKTVAAASARLAQQAAKKLKSSSPNGSKPEPENMGQLIRLKSL